MGGWSKGPRAAMDAGSSDGEESLQIAFKKLKVDPESLPGVVSVSEPRVNPWSSHDSSSVKPKLSSPKDNRRGCMRKSSRGVSRNQRRRRSKSPILRSPIFTYCSTMETSAVSAHAGGVSAQKVLFSSGIPGCSGAGMSSTSLQEVPCGINPVTPTFTHSLSSTEEHTREGAGPPQKPEPAGFTDLGKRYNSEREEDKPPAGQCLHQHPVQEVKDVFSFTGLHNALSCERTLPSYEDSSRTHSTAALAPSLSRSCSEQARACVDDFNIEDLCGYMEYYLYIPKEMSTMAEMMYT
ncbi:oxidative stress-responsive serine-rich protein 1 [Thalassophryne amazonica]|uniref:oxidative stress-responsive serine-rich protein 1 n=1 Tax=Thalassophryne amazonica TaxID=390379 RepID=UPI0014719F80|nr:oxidative stress-responsive serine-rich protein 1 [Thalassophryne amazonica]